MITTLPELATFTLAVIATLFIISYALRLATDGKPESWKAETIKQAKYAIFAGVTYAIAVYIVNTPAAWIIAALFVAVLTILITEARENLDLRARLNSTTRELNNAHKLNESLRLSFEAVTTAQRGTRVYDQDQA